MFNDNLYDSICLTTTYITDGSHRWLIDITFIKRPDPKIVLPHRLMNKTPPQSTMYIVGNVPLLTHQNCGLNTDDIGYRT